LAIDIGCRGVIPLSVNQHRASAGFNTWTEIAKMKIVSYGVDEQGIGVDVTTEPGYMDELASSPLSSY
jgi:hypothetical protein